MSDMKKKVQDKLKKANSNIDWDIQNKRAKEFDAINKKITSEIKKDATKPNQQTFSWMPTKTARTSIFAPVAKQELKDSFTQKIFKNAWGKVTVNGPALNIPDENVFLALLYQVKEKHSPVIKINFKQICELLKISVQGRNYTKIKNSIMKLAQVSFVFEMKDGSWSVEHLLSKAKGNKDYSVIEVDEWFFSNFLINEITMIDLQFRQSLKGDVTKALYRFLLSHKGKQFYSIDTLIDALNMNPDREIKLNRHTLKTAFTQLKNKGFLSFIFRDDMFQEIKILKKIPRLKAPKK